MFGYLKGNESSASDYREVSIDFIPVDSRHISELPIKMSQIELCQRKKRMNYQLRQHILDFHQFELTD